MTIRFILLSTLLVLAACGQAPDGSVGGPAVTEQGENVVAEPSSLSVGGRMAPLTWGATQIESKVEVLKTTTDGLSSRMANVERRADGFDSSIASLQGALGDKQAHRSQLAG